MVCSSVQTKRKKAHKHHSFPRRDCSNISSEKARFWATNDQRKCELMHTKQKDSYCHFFAVVLGDPWIPICTVSLKFQTLKLWGHACKKRTMTGSNNNSQSASQSSAGAPEPYGGKHLCSLNLGKCCSLQQMLPITKLHRGLLPVL